MFITRVNLTFALLMLLTGLPALMAIPLPRSSACKSATHTLTARERTMCCSQFNLHCDGIATAALAIAERGMRNPFHALSANQPVMLLGESCGTFARCGAGLKCWNGVCRRIRSARHLRRLMTLGKRVEKDERKEASEEAKENILENGDDDDANPGMLRGQAVSVAAANAGKSAMEEDEVAANIADYLASRGKKLTKKEWHVVRELIAGTIEERTQREEQAAQAEDVSEEVEVKGNATERSETKRKDGDGCEGDWTVGQVAKRGQCAVEAGGKRTPMEAAMVMSN